MNLKEPKDIGGYVDKQISVNGINNNLANFNDLRVQDKTKATIDDIDTNIDHFQMFSDIIKFDISDNQAEAKKWLPKIMEVLGGLENGTNPLQPTRRMLESSVGLKDIDTANLPPNKAAATPGSDNQLDDTLTTSPELKDVPETSDEFEQQLKAIDAVSDKDQGAVGPNSDLDNPDSSSGTSFWTWVMYIAGAILVMALIAGACYLVMQRKDADEFTHEQQNTEMTPEPSHGHSHGHSHNHHHSHNYA